MSRGGAPPKRFGCATRRDFTTGVTELSVSGTLAAAHAALVFFEVRHGLGDQPRSIVLDLDAVVTGAQRAWSAGQRAARLHPGPRVPVLARAPAAGQHPAGPAGARPQIYHSVPQLNAALAALTDPPHRRHIYLPPEPVSVSAARTFVTEACWAWGVSHLVDDAAVIVAELVTNAVEHAGSELDVTAVLAGGRLRLSVRDRSQRRPRLRRPVGPAGPLAVRGRGLWLVEALTAACGVTVHGDGKTVWASLEVKSAGD